MLSSEIFFRATPSMMLLDWLVRSGLARAGAPFRPTKPWNVSLQTSLLVSPKPTVFEEHYRRLSNPNRDFSCRFENDNGKRETSARLSLFPFPSAHSQRVSARYLPITGLHISHWCRLSADADLRHVVQNLRIKHVYSGTCLQSRVQSSAQADTTLLNNSKL